MFKKLSLVLIATVALLVLILLGNTYRKGTRQVEAGPVAHAKVDGTAAAERLAGAVRLKTITYDNKPDASAAEFVKLHGTSKRPSP